MIHSFHIPVMGLAYTIDTPIKVAHLGISSVVSIGDDILIEKAMQYYCDQNGLSFVKSDRKNPEARTSIITAYLNLMDKLVTAKWNQHIKQLTTDDEYRSGFFQILPGNTTWSALWSSKKEALSEEAFSKWVRQTFSAGSIDVNIMTRLDKKNYTGNKELPVEYNDAHAALRGYAHSVLNSSVVLSAGMNLSLFGYMSQFNDFFPDEKGFFRKRIILKVSDFRSALIQGKVLVKKGLWVSEFRIESGLNCGGHAFPTQGYLLGPILEEFKQKRMELYGHLLTLWLQSMKDVGRTLPASMPQIKISAQGGVGTHDEHTFLINYYNLNSVGWGSPFLLVPEAVSIDKDTLERLASAREEDLYLSNASPLGVPFNNLRSNTRQSNQMERVLKGKPGSPCTKKYLKLNNRFGTSPLCTASSRYIKLATKELICSTLTNENKEKEIQKLHEKECLCCGLSMPFLELNALSKKEEGKGVSVCPGPNIAYFTRIYSLREMIQHIYGSVNILAPGDRPNMFLKEIQLYLDYLFEKMNSLSLDTNEKSIDYINQFIANLRSGMVYYKELFNKEIKQKSIREKLQTMLEELNVVLNNKANDALAALVH